MAPRKPFLLRLDPRLWDEIESWAQQDLRSVNGQIEYILREAVRKRKKAFGQEIENESNDSLY